MEHRLLQHPQSNEACSEMTLFLILYLDQEEYTFVLFQIMQSTWW